MTYCTLQGRKRKKKERKWEEWGHEYFELINNVRLKSRYIDGTKHNDLLYVAKNTLINICYFS